jgi:hypothetical protein
MACQINQLFQFLHGDKFLIAVVLSLMMGHRQQVVPEFLGYFVDRQSYRNLCSGWSNVSPGRASVAALRNTSLGV